MESGSEMPSPKVPIIEFTISGSKVQEEGSGSCRPSKANQVRRALEEHGCFVAAYDGVSSQLVDKVAAQSKDLFDLPTETKDSSACNNIATSGYIRPPQNPYYETFAIDHATNLQDVQQFTNLVWPAGNDHFCETTHSYVKLIEELGEMVIRLLFESYGVEGNHYESFAPANNNLFRFIKYNEAKSSDNTSTSVWLVGHTDATFITIIFQHQIGGFEFKTKDGTFVAIDPSPSHFIVVAGDMLQIWSNDRIKACDHQVRVWDLNVERYSMAMFIYHSGTIHVPEEVVDEKHPLLYKQCDCLGYTKYAFSKETQNAESRVKAYCGI